MSEQWRKDRNTVEWVGPFILTAFDASGAPVTIDPTTVRIAFLPNGVRPVDDSDSAWRPMDQRPGGTDYGYMTSVVPAPVEGGFWARIPASPEDIWRSPYDVGWLART